MVEDAVGNKSKALYLTLKTDSIPPSAPTAELDDAGLQLTGKAEANAKIEVRSTKDDSVLGSATVNADGTFTVKLSSALTDNAAVNIYAIDSAGNRSHAKTISGSKDTIAPSSPDISTVTDDSSAEQKTIKNGETTSDTTPVFEGKGELGAEVTIYDNGIAIATTKVDATGKWKFTTDQSLADGVHNLSFTQMDAAKNTSSMSESFTLTVKANTAKVALSVFAVDDVSDLLVAPASMHDDSQPQTVQLDDSTILSNGFVSSSASVLQVQQVNIADLLSSASLVQDTGDIDLAHILPTEQNLATSQVTANMQVENTYIEPSSTFGTELDLLSNLITYYV